MKFRTILLALPTYYVMCCLLAVLFASLSGEIDFVEVPQSIGVMLLVGWVAMLAALDNSAMFGSPHAMQLAMVLGVVLTPTALSFIARTKRFPDFR